MTKDLAFMLKSIGMSTGVNLERLPKSAVAGFRKKICHCGLINCASSSGKWPIICKRAVIPS